MPSVAIIIHIFYAIYIPVLFYIKPEDKQKFIICAFCDRTVTNQAFTKYDLTFKIGRQRVSRAFPET